MQHTNSDSIHPLKQLIVELGALRLMLGVLAIIMVIFAPSADMGAQLHGWGLLTTNVLPALGPIVFFVLLLDMLMSRVLMSDKVGAARRGYRRAILFDGIMALLILLSWLPFLLDLLADA